MVMCFVPDCRHYSERGLCRYFRFPRDEEVKKIWLKNIRRADKLPTKFSYVCSCHFKDKLKANTPTIFERNKDKILMLETPEKKTHKSSQEIERCKLDVKICASPGRDGKSEDSQLTAKEAPDSMKRKEPTEFVQLSDTLEFTRSVAYPPAKKAEVVPDRDAKFTVMVDNLECYEFLKQMTKFYELCKVMKNLPPDIKRALINFQKKKEEKDSG